MANPFQTALVGGDTNSWDGPLVISVTILGEVTAREPSAARGARRGDWLFVTGPLGGSILGNHLTFTPRIAEAQSLHELVDLHAMIDISDGLAADLNHICEESRLRRRPAFGGHPDHAEAQQMADGRTPLEHALSDGEDFELIFAVSPADAEHLVATQPIAGVTLTEIGEVIEAGLWLTEKGQRRPTTAGRICACLGMISARLRQRYVLQREWHVDGNVTRGTVDEASRRSLSLLR